VRDADGAYRLTTLASGVRVIAVPMRQRASVSVSIMVAAGSRYEDSAHAGVAHLIEHMVFKGSRRYPTAQALSEAIEGVGGVLNAATDKELTSYWAKVPAAHLDTAVAVLSDMVFHAGLDATELDKERQVVIEELHMYQDSPQDHVGTLFDEAMWPGHPLGRDTAGTEESVRALQRTDLLRFLRQHYHGDAVLVSVAGALDIDEATERVAAAVGGWGRGGRPQPLPAEPPPPQPQLRLVSRRTEQANLIVGARVGSYLDPDRFAVDLLTTVLGEGMSSRLFLKLREERALVYDVHAFTLKVRDSGALCISLGCEPRRAVEALGAALGELERLAAEPVGDAELRKARAYATGRLLIHLEGTSALGGFLGQQALLLGEILEPEEVVARLEAVQAADLQRVARQCLEAGLHGAVVGPFRDARKFLTTLSRN